MKARCKFRCTGLGYISQDQVQVKMNAIHEANSPVAEDQAFTKYTPNGEFSAVIANPSVIPMLKLGNLYYLDVIPAD